MLEIKIKDELFDTLFFRLCSGEIDVIPVLPLYKNDTLSSIIEKNIKGYSKEPFKSYTLRFDSKDVKGVPIRFVCKNSKFETHIEELLPMKRLGDNLSQSEWVDNLKDEYIKKEYQYSFFDNHKTGDDAKKMLSISIRRKDDKLLLQQWDSDYDDNKAVLDLFGELLNSNDVVLLRLDNGENSKYGKKDEKCIIQ